MVGIFNFLKVKEATKLIQTREGSYKTCTDKRELKLKLRLCHLSKCTFANNVSAANIWNSCRPSQFGIHDFTC